MKVSKLLVLATLVASLCIVGSAEAACTAILADGLGPTGGTYDIGDTIEYTITVSVPAGATFCTLTDVSVYFFPPPGAPAGGACGNTGSGILIASGLILVPGAAAYEFDSSDNAALAYLVTEADCTDPIEITAGLATTFLIEGGTGALQCDEKEAINSVNPVDAPVCNILGPTEICRGATEVEFCSEFTADTYLWEISGDGEIVGPADQQCVDVNPTGSDTFTLTLTVCNDNGDGGCCNECEWQVDVVPAPDCLINGPDSICEDAVEVEFCSDAVADSYFWEITSGDAVIVGSDTGSCVLVSPGTSAQFELKLSVCFADPQCCDSCTKTVDVIPNPDCLITGSKTVCENATGIQYCSDATADTYSWGISGNGTIVGPTDQQCVTVDAGLAGTFLLTLEVCNESDTGNCCSRCELEVTVESCGLFCSFTQGFWGNAGGKACNGKTTTELLVDLLDAANASAIGTDPVIVGVPAVRSITFRTADSILLRLPAGGTPSALPVGLNVFASDQAALEAAKLLKKKGDTINNVLVGQVVTLTLNLRLNGLDLECDPEVGDLSAWVLPEEFCTIGEDGCPEHYTIPESLWGDTVASLLIDANKILAGQAPVSGASIGDIYDAVTAINEGFDECRETISCPTEEVCDNGCDDDFDGLTDEGCI